MSELLVRSADVGGRRVDVRVSGDRIVAVAPDLPRDRAAEVVDAAGGALLPGLHDHHIHLHALAAAQRSVGVGPPEVVDRDGLARALRNATSGLDGWIRGIGYHESVAGDLDRDALDELVPDRPVRVHHRTGALWILNSAALSAVGLGGARVEAPPGVERRDDGTASGRLWRLDAWLAERLPSRPADLALVGEVLLRHGVTGLTDATPTEDASAIADLASAVREGRLPQEVAVTGGPGFVPELAGGLLLGPVKILRPDHEPPDLDGLIRDVHSAREQGRNVAIHCVTAAAALAVVALEVVGPRPGDRIEHGAVLSAALAGRIAELGITVVTNPGFVSSRGDQYLTDVDEAELEDLWPCGRLIDAHVPLGAGTDAPFGDPNPWRAMAAAVDRRTAGRGCAPLIEDICDPLTGEIHPVVVVTDNGPAFRSAAFARFIASRPELTHVRTRHRSPGTNGVRERGFGTLKYEQLYHHDIDDGIDLARHVEHQRQIFNTRRPHEALDWRFPRDVYLTTPPNFPHPETEPDS